MGWLSSKTGQFAYFARQLGEQDWHGKYVLDFGGNIGNMLRDPESTIDHERYWCVDVVNESIERGKAAFPRAHWVYYDRYSFFFNPHGRRQLTLPEFPQSFDYIVAYSVFPNTPRSDLLDLVDQLKGRLAEGGALAFTFIDPNYNPWPDRYDGNNFTWRLEREMFLEQERGKTLELNVGELSARTRDASWFIFVNSEDLYLETDPVKNYEPEQQQTHFAFYSAEYMQSLFPEATVLQPANGEMQHCCVIRK